MSVSNLTNTIWVMNNTLSSGPQVGAISFSVDFTSNETNYTEITLPRSGADSDLIYDNTTIYNFARRTWSSQSYRIIKITGGTDVTNANLISWLEANATQVQVDDLTDTKWVLNSSLNVSTQNSFTINFTSNSENYDTFVYGSNTLNYVINSNPGTVYYEGTWSSQSYRIILILNGSDVSNPDLIVWLTNNATYQVPTPTITYDLTQLQLSAGTHTIQVKARATGYRDSNFSNSVSYVVASGYQVTVNITLPSAETASWRDVEHSQWENFNNGNAFTTLTETINVQATNDFRIILGSLPEGGTSIVTGGVSQNSTSWGFNTTHDYVITGNGTITINITSWD